MKILKTMTIGVLVLVTFPVWGPLVVVGGLFYMLGSFAQELLEDWL